MDASTGNINRIYHFRNPRNQPQVESCGRLAARAPRAAIPPPPPAEKTTARQDQAGQSSSGRWPNVHSWGLTRWDGGNDVNDAVDGACSAASKCHRLVGSKPERFKEVRPGNDDGVPKFWRNWRGHDDVMQTRLIRGSGEPVWVIALLKCALTIGTRSAQSIMASGFTAAQTGRTHDRTRPMLQKRQKVLAKAAPSTHDPMRTYRDSP